MYKINGWFPIVRCVCGREYTLQRAWVCACGVTLRVRYKGKTVYPGGPGCVPDGYDLSAQPYQMAEVVGWQDAETVNGKHREGRRV